MRIERHGNIVRLHQGGCILSELRDAPGPTHGLFDVLAACIFALARNTELRMLGFAGGGVIAPLRAMGYRQDIHAVDLSLKALNLFEELCSAWAGQVQVTKEDAQSWLAKQGSCPLILEDLSVLGPGGETKPELSLTTLPALIHERLSDDGIVIYNILPVPGWSWKRLLTSIAAPHQSAQVLVLDEFENKVLIAGRRLASASHNSRDIRKALASIRSRQAKRFSLRGFTPSRARRRA